MLLAYENSIEASVSRDSTIPSQNRVHPPVALWKLLFRRKVDRLKEMIEKWKYSKLLAGLKILEELGEGWELLEIYFIGKILEKIIDVWKNPLGRVFNFNEPNDSIN